MIKIYTAFSFSIFIKDEYKTIFPSESLRWLNKNRDDLSHVPFTLMMIALFLGTITAQM